MKEEEEEETYQNVEQIHGEIVSELFYWKFEFLCTRKPYIHVVNQSGYVE